MTASNIVKDEIDFSLIEACINGEKPAWDNLVEKVSGFVYYCIHKISMTPGGNISNEDIADIYQDVFFALCKNDFHKLRSYKWKCKFTTWLSFVIRSVYIDYLRKKKKDRVEDTVSIDEPLARDDNLEDLLTIGETLTDGGNGIVTQLQREEIQKIVQVLIKDLPLKEKMLIQLFYTEGKKYREIAEIMEMPINTVASTMSRVKVSLGAKLEKRGLSRLGTGSFTD